MYYSDFWVICQLREGSLISCNDDDIPGYKVYARYYLLDQTYAIDLFQYLVMPEAYAFAASQDDTAYFQIACFLYAR